MIDYAFYNGKITTYDEASIPLCDRSVFFGDAVYDVMVGYRETVCQQDKHLDRLFENAKRIFLPLSFDKRYIVGVISDLIRQANPTGKFTLYVQLSRSAKRRSHVYDRTSDVNTLITLCAAQTRTKSQISLVSCKDIRYEMCDVKTVNLLPAVLAANYAESQGADEAVFIRDGRVTECSHSNIFILKADRLYTHPADKYILNGIMRRNLIELAEGLGIVTVQTAFSLDELKSADEVFVTSTTAFAKRCVKIDGMPLPMRRHNLANKLIFILQNSFFNTNIQRNKRSN